jgi:pyridoxine 5-phosphate synthase
MRDAGIYVSLFLDPEPRQLDLAKALGAEAVELHTGKYALANWKNRDAELKVLADASKRIRDAGLALHAGHGLNYQNVGLVAAIADLHELNIGHAIVSRAVFIGLREAVREMKSLIQ